MLEGTVEINVYMMDHILKIRINILNIEKLLMP